MAANYKAELVGVFGQPVAENPTGVMQEAGFAAAGLNWRYITVEVPPYQLEDAVKGMRAFNMAGINLTIPHKVAIIPFLDGLSREAEIIGAVNTVVRRDGRYIGENTDGKGFVRGMTDDAGVDPRGKRIVILGAGGAARAVSTELALAGARQLLVVNRTAERGQAMVNDLQANTEADVQFLPWQGTYAVPGDVDILVNATSIGLYPDPNVPDVDLSGARGDMLVCDAVFNPPQTGLLTMAQSHGLPTLDGLSMLVYQGVIAFKMWTGVDPYEAIMKKALADALGV